MYYFFEKLQEFRNSAIKNLSNLDESKTTLNEIINLTDDLDNNITNNIYQIIIFRQKTNMLLGAISLNLGEYNNSLKAYFSCENDLPKICKEPELNVKLSAVYLNIGLSYIYLGNKNIAEKYLKKALSQTEGILGNDVIHKLNADIFENLGAVYEMMNRYKDSLIFYKKSLKLKDRESNKQVALGTSKLNYMDPRITVSWCKKNEVNIEKLFSKSTRDKFPWAMYTGPDYKF